MGLKASEWILILFNVFYILGFTIFYILIGNFEFLVYVAVMVILFLLVLGFQRRIGFSNYVLWGLSLWGLLHMMGGGVRVGDSVLYAMKLIPIIETENYFILKFDQFVHAYLYFVMVFVLYTLIKPNVRDMPKALLYILLFAASVGIGAGNEIVEFSAVLFFPETGVGGYYNNAWDLVFNALGAMIAVIVLSFKFRKSKIA